MKKIFKFLFKLSLLNLGIGILFLSYLGVSTLKPSLNKADISFTDIVFKREIEQSKIQKFEEEIYRVSSEMGTKSANKLIDSLSILLPKSYTTNNSNLKKSTDDISIDEILSIHSNNVKKGIEEALSNSN